MARIPLAILTGFLGSGKTTLLSALVRRTDMAGTAVIVNEFGEIALDHDLIGSADERIVELAGGCVCCALRSDLADTVADLLARSDSGVLRPISRIVVETTGLADPGPLAAALARDRRLAASVELSGIVTTVDAVLADATLDVHPGAARQVAVADRLVLTKTDLAGAPSPRLLHRLANLNPHAPVLTAYQGDIGPDTLFPAGAMPFGAGVSRKGREARGDPDTPHDGGISTYALVRAAPLRALTLPLFLEALAEHCGPRLLRMKGLVSVAEFPGRPAVIHGVQHVFHPPAWLDAWPGVDHSTRLVFIVEDVPRIWPGRLLDVLDAEVALYDGSAGEGSGPTSAS